MLGTVSRKIMLWIPLLMSMATGVIGVLPDFGTCPNIAMMENFNLQKFLGKWYEAEKYFSLMSVGTKCSTSNYTMSEEGTIRVIESHISTLSRISSSAIGNLAPISRNNQPKYDVRFDTVGIPYTMSYWILGTDYENYAVVWSCTNMGLFSFKSAWILTRQRHPQISVLESAYRILERNQISKAYLFRTDQKNCPEDY